MVSAHPSPLSLRIYQAKGIYYVYTIYIPLQPKLATKRYILYIYYLYTIYIHSIYRWLVLDMGNWEMAKIIAGLWGNCARN